MVDGSSTSSKPSLNVDLAAELPGRSAPSSPARRPTSSMAASRTDGVRRLFGDSRAAEGRGRRPSLRVLLVTTAVFRNLLAPQLTAAGSRSPPSRRGPALTLCRGRREFRPHHQRHRDAEHERLRVLRGGQSATPSGRERRSPRCRPHRMPARRTSPRVARSADDYVAKYDRDGLVHTLNETLAEVRGAA